MKFKFTPHSKAALFVMIYAGTAIGFNPTASVGLHLAATLGLGLVLFVLYSKTFKKKKSLEDTIITSLILFLLLHYGTETADILYPLLATFIAITAKFFFEIKGRPIFNPAVGGLLGLVVLGWLIPALELPFISWWGVNTHGVVALALMAGWILTELKIWRKYAIVITFLVGNALVLWAQGKIELLQFAYTDATLYFLVAIMLVEPKTSPMKHMDQIVYALIALAAYHLLPLYGVGYAGILTVAIANLYNVGIKFRPQAKKTVIKV